MNIGHVFLWIFFVVVFLCFWAASFASFYLYRRLRRKDLIASGLVQQAIETAEKDKLFNLVGDLMKTLAGSYPFLQDELSVVQENNRKKECCDYFHYLFLYDMYDKRDRFKNAIPAFIIGGFLLIAAAAGTSFMIFNSDSLWEFIKTLFFLGYYYVFLAIALMGIIHLHKKHKALPAEMEKIDTKLNEMMA